MKHLLLLLCLFLASCAFVENITSRPKMPDQRIPLDRFQVLRDVPRREVENYKCRDGTPIVAESITGWLFDLRCDGVVR